MTRYISIEHVPVIKPLGAQLYHRAVWVKVGDCNRVYKFNTFIGWVRYQNLNADDVKKELLKLARSDQAALEKKLKYYKKTHEGKKNVAWSHPWHLFTEKQRKIDAGSFELRSSK